MKNIRIEKDISRRKEQANFFAQKGGHLRDVSSKMKKQIEKLEQEVVDVRREDKTIKHFDIPVQKDIGGVILQLDSVAVAKNHKFVNKKVNITLNKKERLFLLCNSDAEYLMLSVSDTGTGMDEATMERIYEPFFTTKPVNEGTGLGLSVVHGIVKSCKGEITVESSKGKGSTFRVFLPVIEEETEEIKIPGNPVEGKGRVLFIDDEPATVKYIYTMLSKLGYTAETANSPVEALELFNRNPAHFDLIITDLTMPVMNGIELAGKIHEKNPDLPIILMTGYGKDIDYATPPEDYGIRRILKKPVRINMLASTIDEIINLQEKKV